MNWREWKVLDKQDEFNEDVILRFCIFLAGYNDSMTDDGSRAVEKKLKMLMTSLQGVNEALNDLDEWPKHSPLVQQYTDNQLFYKEGSRNMSDKLLKLDLDDELELVALHTSLNKIHFVAHSQPKH